MPTDDLRQPVAVSRGAGYWPLPWGQIRPGSSLSQDVTRAGRGEHRSVGVSWPQRAAGQGAGPQTVLESLEGVTGGEGLPLCLACPGEEGALCTRAGRGCPAAPGDTGDCPPGVSRPGRGSGCGRGALCRDGAGWDEPQGLCPVCRGCCRCSAAAHHPPRRCQAAAQHLSSSAYLTCSKCCTRRNLDVIFLCLHVNVGRCCPD